MIGPVRSAREDDLQLLRQFGRPAFAYSGATPALLPYIQATARIVDLYAGTTRGYYRDNSRVAPHNLYAHTRQLLAQARGASKARDIGFRFGPPPPGGKATRSASVAYPAASFGFTWSAAKGRWLVSMDGAAAVTTDGGRLAPATVVIQHTTVRTSRFLEYGKPPPFAESVGSGTALVLRDGKAWQAHWSRPAAGGGTTFTTASGQPMTFAPGQVWVVLAYRSSASALGCGAQPARDQVLVPLLAAHADGIACVIGDPTFRAMSRVRSLTPELSKGLEFDLVVLIDPEAFGKGIEGAVNRYVAMTRATQQLVILTSSLTQAKTT